MKRKQFTEQQIIGILKEHEAGEDHCDYAQWVAEEIMPAVKRVAEDADDASCFIFPKLKPYSYGYRDLPDSGWSGE